MEAEQPSVSLPASLSFISMCSTKGIHRKAEEKLGDSKVMLLFGLTECQPWYWTLECDY